MKKLIKGVDQLTLISNVKRNKRKNKKKEEKEERIQYERPIFDSISSRQRIWNIQYTFHGKKLSHERIENVGIRVSLNLLAGRWLAAPKGRLSFPLLFFHIHVPTKFDSRDISSPALNEKLSSMTLRRVLASRLCYTIPQAVNQRNNELGVVNVHLDIIYFRTKAIISPDSGTFSAQLYHSWFLQQDRQTTIARVLPHPYIMVALHGRNNNL